MAGPAIPSFVLAAVQHGFQIRERVMGRAATRRAAAPSSRPSQRFFAALVFVVVAIEAQQFPSCCRPAGCGRGRGHGGAPSIHAGSGG